MSIIDQISAKTLARLQQLASDRQQDVEAYLKQLIKQDTAAPIPIFSALEGMTDAFFLLDRQWRFMYLNRMAGRLLQRQQNDLIGKNVWEEFPPAVDMLFYTEYQRAMTSGESTVFAEFYPPLDKWFEVHAHPSDVGLAVYFRDITARRRLEDTLQTTLNELELRVRERTRELSETNDRLRLEIADRERAQRAQERLANILESTSDYVSITNDTGAILYMNRAARERLGVEVDADLSQYRSVDFYDRADFINLLKAAMPAIDEHGVWRGETVIRSLGGEYIPTSHVMMRHYESETEILYSSLSRDISDQKRVEHELREALERERELSELKTRFTTTVSHEFRTPLATIQSSSDLLRRHSDRLSPERKDEYLDKIQRQVRYLAHLLDQVATLNRSDVVGVTFAPEMHNLTAICQEIIDDLRPYYDETHTFDTAALDETPDCLLDAHLIREMVINLLSNAIKYSPSDCVIRIELCRADDMLQLTVRDEGIGISAEDQKRMFDSFYRGGNIGNTPGTGLGGVLIMQAVEAHEGTIDVQSAVDQGTTITVHLPIRL